MGPLGSFPRVLSQLTGEQKQMWMGRGPGTTLSIPTAVLSGSGKKATYKTVSLSEEELCNIELALAAF